MIKLNDLLQLTENQISKSKVKFNLYNGNDNPIDLYKSNPNLINKQWLYWRNKQRYFREGQIAICLVRIRGDYWLLTTIDSVVKELDITHGINYEGSPLKEYQKYFGRVIIKYHKRTHAQGFWLNTIVNELEVCQILPDTFDDDDFPGYDKVRLDI